MSPTPQQINLVGDVTKRLRDWKLDAMIEGLSRQTAKLRQKTEVRDIDVR